MGNISILLSHALVTLVSSTPAMQVLFLLQYTFQLYGQEDLTQGLSAEILLN